jgi:RNA polymerase sigma-70 factor (ECF subfamily)
MIESGTVISDEVMTSAKLGDEGAWAEIYDALAAPLLSYLRHLGADSTMGAEDLLGETFLHIARSLPTFSGTATELRPWAFRIARNRLVDLVRSRARRPEDPLAASLDDDSATPNLRLLSDSDYEKVLNQQVLVGLLNALTPEHRDVIWLRFIEDLDTEQVGEITGRSANAVAAMTRRALNQLHVLMQDQLTDR